jgi:uncharacterized membrane protein HdeD (DUF308 family)/alpha-beta hydrolase superfamily lysophospholipase
MAWVRLKRNARRWSALPALLEGAPLPVLAGAGLGLVILGALIVTRPLTSIALLGVYVGVSAMISGAAELATHPSAPRWRRLYAALWMLGGMGILVFLERSLDILPRLLAALLILGGLASLGDVIGSRRLTERILAGAWGVSQIVFGILAFAWPDVTVLVVAVVFGIRTIVFGGTLLVRSIRSSMPERSRPPPDAAPAAAPGKRAQILFAGGRILLSVLLLFVSAAGWALNDWLEDGAPVIDAFYDPPEEVPSAHGRLIRMDDFAGEVPPGAEVSRILYTTRDALGRPAVASGLVIVPTESRPGARPVVAWNHGTTGVARGCAPSLRDASATRWAIPALDDAIERGWVVVASDYSGQGAPGVFPYLIGRGEARSSLDAVLAAREIPGLALLPDVVAWGHSQGGHAALWMSQIAADYAPDLDVLGTAVLAPAAEPLELAQEVGASRANALLTVLVSWVLVPYADTYPDVRLDRYIAPGSRAIVREMTQRCPTEPGVIVSVVTALGVSEDRPLFASNLTAGPLGERLAANAATGPWDAPLLIAWGDADEVIPPRLQERFVQRLCGDGERVRWVVYRDYGHLQTLLPGSRFLPVLVNWTRARLLGEDTPIDDCSRLG